ncbi:MAG: transcription-repair coupling factor [Bacteroidetes bacterium]|nr:transcription-repair coupling factor [Bacteroidota bacterium]
MDLLNILQKYQNQAQAQRLRTLLLERKQQRIFLQGLAGSSDAVFIASHLHQFPQPALFILGDREEAAYFQNDLENILGDQKAVLYPSSYKKPYQLDQPDNNSVLHRAEVLTRINKSREHFIVITYPEAIHEKVITKKSLERNTMEVKVGEKLSIDFLTEFMQENVFEQIDFVYEPGQFAIRGGIIDIYSFAHELPYRIELFGDKIESIRSFDPSTQLSEKSIGFVTIIPNIQSGLVKEEHESFLDFLPAETNLYIKDFAYTLNAIESSLEKVNERYGSEVFIEEEQVVRKVDELFDSLDDLRSKIEPHLIVEFGTKPFFENRENIAFNISPQPHFNKNFNLLLDNLYKNQEKSYTNYLFSESAKQSERLYSIFEDIPKPDAYKGIELKFHTILTALHQGFIDHDLKLICYTDHQVFDRYHRFRLKKNYSKSEAITLKEIYSLKPGDFITHIDHGVGRFAGLETLDVNGKQQEAIRLVYKDNDILYISIHSLHRIARYSSKDGTAPTLNKLGSTAWSTLKSKTKKKVKDIAKDLIALYAKRRAQSGFAFTADSYMQTELEASFMYEDTPDQLKSTRDVKKDMEKEYPMDRLICGDVGFGKTEIAIRAAFKAVADGKQVAVLVPTTILALQHYRTFSERLKEFPCTIDYLNRFKSTAEQTATLKKLEAGKIDILIGTHRILSKDVFFKDLGLMIIDEEQKFGVAAKEKLKALRVNVDTLTLTATPIPRTLQFSLMGARDLSIINTAPPNRHPVNTEVHVFNEHLIRDAINYEVSRGGQVFFVHNRVQDIHDISAMIHKLCPDVKISVGHGQMDGEKLEEILINFIEGDTDVLVATTIIESGLDISNANTIIINNAHYFGLSDLHQMRGRVGRSNKKAFCYLLAPPLTVLTPEARQRLKAIEEHSELGSGFHVAMRDLDIRGAGNLLGGEQSGFISEIGFEMYHKILDEAIQELKETDFKGLFPEDESITNYVRDCQIDTDLEMRIPDDYITNITERFSLYKELDEVANEEKLVAFGEQLRDRFGPVPKQVYELMHTIRLRWKAKQLGFEKIVLKNRTLKTYFISNKDSAYFQSTLFSTILKYVQNHPRACKLKEDKGKLSLTLMHVDSVKEADSLLARMMEKEVELKV